MLMRGITTRKMRIKSMQDGGNFTNQDRRKLKKTTTATATATSKASTSKAQPRPRNTRNVHN